MTDAPDDAPDGAAEAEDPKAAARAAALEAAKERQRIERVALTNEASRQLVIGWAMVIAVVIGSPALADAVYGRGAIEDALGRFAACLAACLFAGNLIANQLEKAPDPDLDDDDGEADEGPASSDRGAQQDSRTQSDGSRPVDLAGAADTR